MVGIESDQLVYDYLSKVGDIAQRRSLTSGDRMRLVTRLRTEIERRRAVEGADTPAAVRRILDGLGTPDEAVSGASGGSDGADASGTAGAAGRVPAQRREPGADGAGAGGRPGVGTGTGAVRFPDTGAPPHLATEEELRGPSTPVGAADEWWRVERTPFDAGGGTTTHGFTGGIEIPDMLKPPPGPEELARQQEQAQAAVEAVPGERPGDAARPSAAVGEQAPSGTRAGGLRRRFPLRRLVGGGRAGGPGAGVDGAGAAGAAGAGDGTGAGVGVAGGASGAIPVSPVLALVAILLVVGAVLGQWVVMAAGWALAYITRRLTQTESKWAVMGVPGLTAGAAVVWLWGRLEHRWGAPIAEGELGAALAGTVPVVVRAAAVGSALFVLWRARRPG
ncbi:hypothetical protein ACSNOK_28750 [Streptomyces sp. URMC 126]|uniref:hypothetical protein n=1 Tax=Streptomyces sp. URMC 126 TaxID=3423401 RepID=UPI003F19E0E1